jgi:hypothetical protein
VFKWLRVRNFLNDYMTLTTHHVVTFFSLFRLIVRDNRLLRTMYHGTRGGTRTNVDEVHGYHDRLSSIRRKTCFHVKLYWRIVG